MPQVNSNIAKKRAVLDAALKIVPFEGWNQDTLQQAVISAGLDVGYSGLLFPAGVIQLIDYFCENIDEQMLHKLKSLDTNKMKVREKITVAVQERLKLQSTYKLAVSRTLSFFSLPGHYTEGIKILWRTADKIWRFAGDTATDFNYYSKRTLLSGVYSSTLLFWLGDDSKNHKETFDFLDRRIENVLAIGKFLNKK